MTQQLIDFNQTFRQMESAHIFYLTENSDSYIENAVAYTVDGIRQGECVLFVENSRIYPLIEKKLQQVLTAEERKSILYINNFDFYWRKGNFHPEAILDYFEKVVGSITLNDRRCRTWGHIEWGSNDNIEEKIITYEKEVDRRVPQKQLISVCAYDAARVSQSLCSRLTRCHELYMEDKSLIVSSIYDDEKAWS